VSASKAGKPKPARGFTRWTKNQTKMVTEYFAAWIENTDRKGLPGKADILPFLTSHDEITHEWTIVRNKVLNEKMAFAKRRKVVLEDLE
jgi:hypothetical protein